MPCCGLADTFQPPAGTTYVCSNSAAMYYILHSMLAVLHRALTFLFVASRLTLPPVPAMQRGT
jgi:hypothetical protein